MEKLYVTLRYQIHGESVSDGSRGLSHGPFVCAMDMCNCATPLPSCHPTLSFICEICLGSVQYG